MQETDTDPTMAVKRLHGPLSRAAIADLHAGQQVLLSGTLFTARDAVHKLLADGEAPPCDLTHAAIYHCGPVVVDEAGRWRIVAAGPTTSAREEPYMATLIERFALRAVIGKGGMGDDTRAACQRFGCVYLHAVGGAAQVLAQTIKRVENVYLKDRFGSPEAIWQLVVEDFPALVTIDSHGSSLHRRVAAESAQHLKTLLSDI